MSDLGHSYAVVRVWEMDIPPLTKLLLLTIADWFGTDSFNMDEQLPALPARASLDIKQFNEAVRYATMSDLLKVSGSKQFRLVIPEKSRDGND